MPINRLVAFVLGPAITLISGYISLFAAKNIPGLHLTQKGVAGALTLGAVTLAPMILSHLKIQKWLDGWQQWEKQTNDATNGALDANFKKFLEDVAAKTGVTLPTGEVLTDGAVVGTDVPAAVGLGEPVVPTETGPPQPPASEPGVVEATGDVFSEEPPPAVAPGAFSPPPAQQQR